jgi:hypothetical protein
MADTSINHDAEHWVVESALPEHFSGAIFKPRKMKLAWGGVFAFDAVSEDGSVVVAISTSAARTATGKLATAKYHKLKTDALYLLHLEAPARKVMIFTEPCMQDYFVKAANAGRFPPTIELLHISLPGYLQEKVLETRVRASEETSPLRRTNAA